MLEKLKEWWNRPDPTVKLISFLLEEQFKYINLYYMEYKAAKAWKAKAKKQRDELLDARSYFMDGHGDLIVEGKSLLEKIKNLSSDYEDMLDEMEKYYTKGEE